LHFSSNNNTDNNFSPTLQSVYNITFSTANIGQSAPAIAKAFATLHFQLTVQTTVTLYCKELRVAFSNSNTDFGYNLLQKHFAVLRNP